MSEEKKGAMVQLNVRCSAELRDWLEDEASHVPFAPGPGKKKNQRISEYVRLALEAHRLGGRHLPTPTDPSIVHAGQWLSGLPQEIRGMVVIIAESLLEVYSDQDGLAAVEETFQRMVQGKLRRKQGRKRR